MADNPFEDEARCTTPTTGQPSTLIDDDQTAPVYVSPVLFDIDTGSPHDGRSPPHALLSQSTEGEAERVSLDAVARRLLADNFILSALELHTELLESGRDLKRLRDFFSNPANFEPRLMVATGGLPEGFLVSNLQRTSSVQTFDSLDMTRVSDDADRPADESVAVLEFELRKAKEMIRSLREQLTNASVIGASSGGSNKKTMSTGNLDGNGHSSAIPSATATSATVSTAQYEPETRPLAARILAHERRALNFLVNEYLMEQNLKLTAVTFSEEVSDQDFEDWDEVGLNQPRPNDLLTMYRQLCRSIPHYIRTSSAECQTDAETEDGVGVISAAEQQQQEDVLLPESDQPFFAELQDSASGQLLNRLNEENGRLLMKNETLSHTIERLDGEIRTLKSQLMEKTTLHGEQGAPSSNRSNELPVKRPSPRMRGMSALLAEGTKHSYERHRKLPKAFTYEMEGKFCDCTLTIDEERLLGQVDNSNCATVSEWVECVSACLPHIIPNVLLNKRTEIVPLIVPAAVGNPNADVREELISALFNLIKRPEKRQRRVIVAGCVAVARRCIRSESVGDEGASHFRVDIESELLPLCWEQIGHKHPERRLLVAELCTALAPLIEPPLLGSLVLSTLQQMISEEREDEVRCALVVSVASLTLYIEDQEKFNSLHELVQRVLTDASERVRERARSVLLPCFALWADSNGRLQSDLLGMFIRRLTQLITVSGGSQVANESLMCAYVGCLSALTPLLFWTVLRSGPYGQHDTSDTLSGNLDANDFVDDVDIAEPTDRLSAVYCENERHYLMLKSAYDAHTSLEWYNTLEAFDFVVRDMLPQLIGFLDRLDPQLISIVRRCIAYLADICRTFGRGFAASKLRPLFTPSLNVPSQNLGAQAFMSSAVEDSTNHLHLAISHATFPVYCAGVLSAWQTEPDWVDLRRFLRWKMLAVAETNASTQSVVVAFCELNRIWSDRTEALLAIVWESVPHKNANVRTMCARIFNELTPTLTLPLIKARILPALVTLAADSNCAVRVATLKGFACILEAHSSADEVVEKIRLQLSSLFDDVDFELVSQLVRALAQSAPVLDPTFRDDYLLPHLAALVGRLSETGPNQGKKATVDALFEAYSSLSCCFLSSSVLSDRFLPPMRRLVGMLDSEHAKVAASIVREAEAKIIATSPTPAVSTAATSNIGSLSSADGVAAAASNLTPPQSSQMNLDRGAEELRNKMVNTFRDFKGRVDQHARDAVLGASATNLFSRGSK